MWEWIKIVMLENQNPFWKIRDKRHRIIITRNALTHHFIKSNILHTEMTYLNMHIQEANAHYVQISAIPFHVTVNVSFSLMKIRIYLFIPRHDWIIYLSLSHTDFKLTAFSFVSNSVFAVFSLVVGVFVHLGAEQLHAIANAGIREDEIFG